MMQRLLLAALLIPASLAVAVSAVPASAAPTAAVPGCAGGGPNGPNCLQGPTNGTAVSPAPAISYAFSTRYHQTSAVGTFTATFTPPYKICPNPGAVAYTDMPCMLSRTVTVDARLYVPGASAASGSFGVGPVPGGACDLTTCAEQLTLAAPYVGPGTVLLHYSEQAIVNGGQFEDHSFDVAVDTPAVPLLGLSHIVSPTVVFHGIVSGEKRVTLKPRGVPSSASGLFAVIYYAYPKTKSQVATLESDAEVVKGRKLVISPEGKATVTVTVTGWVNSAASTSGDLLHKVTQERVKGTSVKVAHVPANADAVLMSVASSDNHTTKLDGIAVDFDPVGIVVPLSHGKLKLKLGRGATAYVQGYFSPVGLTDDGAPQFISRTDDGSDFFQLPEL